MLLSVFLTLSLAAPAPQANPSATTTPPVTTASGLEYWDLREGTGKTATAGHKVQVHYEAWLGDGLKFDSSIERERAFVFKLGEGLVIPGWDEGVAGMRVGGRRLLHIPSDLGYGAGGAGGVIPPDADLVFEIELLKVR